MGDRRQTDPGPWTLGSGLRFMWVKEVPRVFQGEKIKLERFPEPVEPWFSTFLIL